MLHTCGVSYWLANHPREFQQLRWAAEMRDKTQPPTSIVVQLFVPSSLSCQVAHSDKLRCRKVRPLDRGRELEARCAVQGVFCNLLIDLYGYVYFSSCFSFLLQIDGFLFSFFFVFKLVNWLFTFPNLFKVINFFSDNFSRTTCDLTDWCIF